MPYEGESASKTAHFDLLKNPEIEAMLQECTYLRPPSDEEAQHLAAHFTETPSFSGELPKFIIAVDGSNHEVSIDQKLPSTKFGFLKIGVILIDLEDFSRMQVGNFIDPFKVAALQRNNSSLTFFVPSANIRWGGHTNVRDSFRALLDKQLRSQKTWFKENERRSSLQTTLFKLAHLRPDEMGTDSDYVLKIHKCPSCEEGPITVEDEDHDQTCPHCHNPVYASDCLRIWEEVNDFQSNQVAMTRLMMILEHLLPAHYMRHFLEEYPALLTQTAFFIDGPLAVFGNAAWLHRSLMTFIGNANRRLSRLNADPVLIIGLQKTGQVADYLHLIDRFIPNDRIFAISDDFRYDYILGGREHASKTFGYETYYGQDFIFKTGSGKLFNFLLPYPFQVKDLNEQDFKSEKVRFENYENLGKACALIRKLESDLYRNAVIPIALAHRFTAISLQPGGKVLDLLVNRTLGVNNNG